MQGAYRRNIERRSLFKQSLNLCAVLADDADIITPCFASPIFFYVKRTELAEPVGREQNLVIRALSNDNFGPVHHRRADEGQNVLAQR